MIVVFAALGIAAFVKYLMSKKWLRLHPSWRGQIRPSACACGHLVPPNTKQQFLLACPAVPHAQVFLRSQKASIEARPCIRPL